MAEQQAAAGGEKAAKKERIATTVLMNDGREVEFVGKQRVKKETVIDEGKIQFDGDLLVLQPGAVSVRMDFVNGETRLLPLNLKLVPKFAGHGGEQKYGDQLAAPSDKPLSAEDMVESIDDLHAQLDKGEWSVRREPGDSFAGASVVIQALVEASGGKKTVADVKAFLQSRLDAAKARDEKLSRKELYDSFRSPESKTGIIIARLERERLAKTAKVDADSELDSFLGSEQAA